MNQLDFILGANLTASGVIKASPGTLRGLFIASHSSGVIKLDNHASAASNSISNGNITLAAGQQFLNVGDAFFTTGIYLEVVSGTVDIVPIYR